MFYFLNTVSYRVLMLPQMLQEEAAFMASEEFQKMKKEQHKRTLMAAIFQTMRSGKRLPMFASHHRIQPRPLLIEVPDAI